MTNKHIQKLEKAILDLSEKDDYIQELEQALADVLDGESWWDIQCFTGLPEKTCRRIEILKDKILKKLYG